MATDKSKHNNHNSSMNTGSQHESDATTHAQTNAQADAHIAALYQQRKRQHLSPDRLNRKIQKRLDDKLSSRVDCEQYKRFGWLKASLLMTLFVLLALPFFAYIQHQVTHINVPNNTASMHGDDKQGAMHNVELYPGLDKARSNDNKQLPQLSKHVYEGLTFTSIIAPDEQQKVQQFNQQIEQFIASSNVQLGLQQQSLYANAVAKGKLIKQKDMWFIEFCGEQPLLLAMDIIEETLLADPLLDETREGNFYDLYSNPTGVIAMLATPVDETKHCPD